MREFSPEVGRAAEMARKAHGDQRYGLGYKNYFEAHVLEVASICEPFGDDAVIAALLHDVVEDTKITAAEIEARFGAQIAGYVALLTDSPGKNRKERKAATYARLEASEDLVPLVVKAADRLANIRACVNTANLGLFEMYRAEHPAFVSAVWRSRFEHGKTGEIWDAIDFELARGDVLFGIKI